MSNSDIGYWTPPSYDVLKWYVPKEKSELVRSGTLRWERDPFVTARMKWRLTDDMAVYHAKRRIRHGSRAEILFGLAVHSLASQQNIKFHHCNRYMYSGACKYGPDFLLQNTYIEVKARPGMTIARYRAADHTSIDIMFDVKEINKALNDCSAFFVVCENNLQYPVRWHIFRTWEIYKLYLENQREKYKFVDREKYEWPVIDKMLLPVSLLNSISIDFQTMLNECAVDRWAIKKA